MGRTWVVLGLVVALLGALWAGAEVRFVPFAAAEITPDAREAAAVEHHAHRMPDAQLEPRCGQCELRQHLKARSRRLVVRPRAGRGDARAG